MYIYTVCRPGNECDGCVLAFLRVLACMGFFALGIQSWSAESTWQGSCKAFAEVRPNVFSVDSNGGLPHLEHSPPLHVAGNVSATIVDNDFAIRMDGVKLERNTEYCQWQEIATQHCERCAKYV